jgi:beta-mannosidase
MVWRLNDSWPIIYWSIIDYDLEPKIAYYFLRRSYDPILVSFEQTRDEIFVWVVNDSPVAVSGDLTVKRRTFEGDTLGERTERVDVAPGEAKRCFATTDLGPVVKRREFLQAEFAQRVISQLLIAERYLHLPAAGLRAQWKDGRISVSSRAFSRQVNLVADGATGAVFEDNFFDLLPGQTREIRLLRPAGAEQIIVDSLNSDPVVLQIR